MWMGCGVDLVTIDKCIKAVVNSVSCRIASNSLLLWGASHYFQFVHSHIIFMLMHKNNSFISLFYS